MAPVPASRPVLHLALRFPSSGPARIEAVRLDDAPPPPSATPRLACRVRLSFGSEAPIALPALGEAAALDLARLLRVWGRRVKQTWEASGGLASREDLIGIARRLRAALMACYLEHRIDVDVVVDELGGAL
jgi:hypothetical protein